MKSMKKYNTKQYAKKKTECLIQLYKEGKELMVVKSFSGEEKDKKKNWENKVLKFLKPSFKNTFLFEELPLTEYERCVSDKKEKLDEITHWWRLRLLNSIIFEQLESLEDFSEGSLGRSGHLFFDNGELIVKNQELK